MDFFLSNLFFLVIDKVKIDFFFFEKKFIVL